MEKKLAFVEHPVSPEEKFKITSQGFKIIDLRYKPKDLPEGAKVFEKPKKK